MLQVSEEELKNRIHYDNPWWGDDSASASRYPKRRHFFTPFYELLTQTRYNRAVILMGTRQIGKSVMMRQAIDHLLESGVPGESVFFVPLNQPVFSGLRLESLLNLFHRTHNHAANAQLYVFFDEVQYLRDWEIHLRALVDDFPTIRFCASGSAAAALKRQSIKSGAGRFTDFALPGLTFAEFLDFRGSGNQYPDSLDPAAFEGKIEAMNREFVDYINFGGFPETAIQTNDEKDFEGWIDQDINDRVLLSDLPTLYGISDQEELKRLFVTIARNSGREISLNELSKKSNVAKNTLNKYIGYLEAAFLIRKLYRRDENGKNFRRHHSFKVYLTNTSLRTAQFGPINGTNSQMLGFMVETAIFNQLAARRGAQDLVFERSRKGTSEVDFVFLDRATFHPVAALEVKWSNHVLRRQGDLDGLSRFISNHRSLRDPGSIIVTTRSQFGTTRLANTTIRFVPAAVFSHAFSRSVEAMLGAP